MSTEQQLVADEQLVKRSLRMMAILVGALVVFVGALSLIAVAVTTKALGGSKAENTETNSSAKKPLSI